MSSQFVVHPQNLAFLTIFKTVIHVYVSWIIKRCASHLWTIQGSWSRNIKVAEIIIYIHYHFYEVQPPKILSKPTNSGKARLNAETEGKFPRRSFVTVHPSIGKLIAWARVLWSVLTAKAKCKCCTKIRHPRLKTRVKHGCGTET